MPAEKYEQSLLPYAETRLRIRDADLLLFHPTTWPGRLIAWGSKSNFSHAAMAIWWGKSLMCVGSEQWKGNQAIHLSKLVARYPGMIEVHRVFASCSGGQPLHVPPELRDDLSVVEEEAVAEQMKAMIGQHYGWWSLRKAALVNARLTRWFWREMYHPSDDKVDGSLPHCAMAIALAFERGIGLDLCPRRAPYATAPADLARSLFRKYLFTLI